MSGRRFDELSCLSLYVVSVNVFVKWIKNAAILVPREFGL